MTEPVISVNGKYGEVVLHAADVEAVPDSSVGVAGGVATLDGTGKLPEGQLPSSVVSSSTTSKKGQIYKATGTAQHAEPVPHIFYAQAPTGSNDTANLKAALETAAEATEPHVRGVVHLPPGTYKASGLVVPTGVCVEGSGPGILREEVNYPNTQIEPWAEGEAIFTLNEIERIPIMNLGFVHNRSFPFDAIVLAASSYTRWLTFINITGYNIMGSLFRIAGYTLWETVIQGLHARCCGSAERGTFDIFELAGRDTNNITFRDCRAIFPQGIGIKIVSEANPSNTVEPGARVITLDNCMLHGGTNESNLTPYTADLILVDGFSDLVLRDNNLANAASGHNAVTLAGTHMTQPSNRAELKGNRIDGPVELTNTKQVHFGPNRWLFGTESEGAPAQHVKINSGCSETTFEPQTVLNGLSFKITDEGSGTVRPATPPATGFFGAGWHGAAVLDGTATNGFSSLSEGVYTMNRDCFCTSMVIHSGVTLKPNSYRIFCTGELKNEGTIALNGNAGNTSTTTAGATGASAGPEHSTTGANVGGNGATKGTSAATQSPSPTYANGGLGGAGGAGSEVAGAARSSEIANAQQFASLMTGQLSQLAEIKAVKPGQSGSGGGASTTQGGGGGGGGGGLIIFAVGVFNNLGTIEAKGGVGGNANTAAGGGGGGGGGGGAIHIIAQHLVKEGTIHIEGGTGGLGSNANGEAGGAGHVFKVLLPQ